MHWLWLSNCSLTCNSPRSWWRSCFKRSIGCFETGLSQSSHVPIPHQSLSRAACKYLHLSLPFVCSVKELVIHPCFKRILRMRLLYDKGNPVNNLLGNKIWYLFLECCFSLVEVRHLFKGVVYRNKDLVMLFGGSCFLFVLSAFETLKISKIS